jgi:lipase
VAILHVHSWGPREGPPVLIVHGVRNTGARYRRLAEKGLPDARVLAPDLRGHGHSVKDPPWHADQHVEDLIETLDHLGISSVTVIGHSFGGLLATWLAAHSPERVEGLVLLDPAIGLSGALAGSSADDTLNDESWASMEEARAARRAIRPPHAVDTVDEDLATFLVQCTDGRYRLNYRSAAVVAAWSEMARPPADLSRFPGRVLLVTAGQANFVTDGLRNALGRDLNDRFTEHVIDAGHMLVWDAFEEVVAHLRHAFGFTPADAQTGAPDAARG